MNAINYQWEDWQDKTAELCEIFANRAADHDRSGKFVDANYDLLKKHGYLSAIIPAELGGGGLSHCQVCDILRRIGQHCGSTGLALSMHLHLLAANVWKYNHGKGGEEVLKKVAEKNLVLVSTGARDWLDSNGEMTRTEGGYLLTAQKYFASQSSGGDIIVTSAPYNDPEKGWVVLHFPIPFTTDGVSIRNDWDTMGMRGTGSNTIILDNVFIPDEAIALERLQGDFHPFWNVVLTVAMPLIMSVYVGITEKAADIAIEHAKNSKQQKAFIPAALGDMNNSLTAARVQWQDMVRIANNYQFEALDQNAQDILSRKVNVANACIDTVSKAMAVVGGPGFYKNFGLERLFRDVQGANFHPLPEKNQQILSGEYILKIS